MWWTCFLDLLRTYQTIAAGLIALTGVVIALMGNSYIARRERRAKILHDRQSLRITLLAELRRIKESMEFRDKGIGQSPADVYALSDDPLTDLFRSSLEKLGLVPSDVLSKVLPAYLAAGHLPKNLRMFQHEHTPAELSAHFVIIPKESYEFVRGMHRDVGKNFGDAIVALENWKPHARDI
jgi:hypothetical protein